MSVFGGISVIGEAVGRIVSATKGDVAEPLADIAERAGAAELGDDNAFSEFLADVVPPSLREFDQAAESALEAAADFADALAQAVDDSNRAYEEADQASAGDLVSLTEELE